MNTNINLEETLTAVKENKPLTSQQFNKLEVIYHAETDEHFRKINSSTWNIKERSLRWYFTPLHALEGESPHEYLAACEDGTKKGNLCYDTREEKLIRILERAQYK